MDEKDAFVAYFNDESSACEAFTWLADAPELQLHVLHERSDQLCTVLWWLVHHYKWAHTTHENREAVHHVALQLLQLLPQHLPNSNMNDGEVDEAQLALLRLMKELRKWSLPGSDHLARVLVELLFQAKEPSQGFLRLTMDLAAGSALRQPDAEAALQEALLACVLRTPESVAVTQRWRDRGLHVVNEQSLPAVVELLPDGTTFEQELVLLSLLVQPQETREHLVLRHGGAELLAVIIRGAGTAPARAFAVAIVKDLATKNTACREEMLRFWLQEQSVVDGPQSDSNRFRDALRRDDERFVGEAILHKLWDDTITESGELAALIEQNALTEYLCKYRGFIEVVVDRLTSTMFDAAASYNKADLWPALLVGLESLKREDCASYPQVVVDTQLATSTALLVLEVEEEEAFWEAAVRSLRSCVRITEANCAVIASRGSIPLLVRLLASQSANTSLGVQLVGLLRDIAGASSLALAAETNQVVMSLCWDRYASGAPSYASLSPVYFQNLLLLYCDIPEMKLGASGGIDQAIAIGAAAELLSARTSETIRVLALNFLHDELGLHECDPLWFSIKSYATAIVSDKLAGIVGIAMDGPEETRQLARRILTALAVCDSAVGEKLRMYQHLEPPVVFPELVSIWERRHLESLKGDEQVYEYDLSDSEDEGLEEAVEDAAVGVAAVVIDDPSYDNARASTSQDQQQTEQAKKAEGEDEWELL